MNPQEQLEFDELKIEVAELKEQKLTKNIQQISFPIDINSVSIIAQALKDAGYSL